MDLAGSEKEDQEDCVQNKHRLEGSNINKSLLALGNCIKILSQSKTSLLQNINFNALFFLDQFLM